MYESAQDASIVAQYTIKAQYEAKERAANYIGQGTAVNALPKQTVLAEVINRLDTLNNNLHDVLSSQKQLLSQLHGPRPEKESEGSIKNSSGGILSNIDEKFNWVFHLVNEIAQNQHILNTLA